MFIYKHLTANSVKLMDFPFRRELAMEAYLLENESVLALDSKNFQDVAILESELSLHDGRKKKTDGRIDILAVYGQEYPAIVELKLGEIQQKHLDQLEDYLKERDQILDKYPHVWDHESNPDPKWIGVMVGSTIAPDLATDIRRGKTILDNIPVAGLTLRRYRGEDGQVYVATDTYFVKKLSGKDYAKYVFNDKTYTKNRLILAVVTSYVISHPKTTFGELKKLFPDQLQGKNRYGVFTSVEEAETIYADTGYKRHFIEPDEVIELKDKKIAVCNQWGRRNIKNFLGKASELGFQIKKAP